MCTHAHACDRSGGDPRRRGVCSGGLLRSASGRTAASVGRRGRQPPSRQAAGTGTCRRLRSGSAEPPPTWGGGADADPLGGFPAASPSPPRSRRGPSRGAAGSPLRSPEPAGARTAGRGYSQNGSNIISTGRNNISTSPINNSTGPINNSTGPNNISTGPNNISTGPNKIIF